MPEIGSEWRMVDGVATAWFGTGSLREGAALAAHVLELSAGASIDLRTTGVRLRLDSDEHAAAASAAAAHLRLTANPAVLQDLSIVFETPNPTEVARFWQRVLDYAPAGDGRLTDPLRRDPSVRIRTSSEHRPLRNRIHLDVVRPAAWVDGTDLGAASGPYGLCHTDPDGNEVDVVPGEALGDGSTTSDWQSVFSAIACYRTASPHQQGAVTAATAALADDAGFPLLVDLRPGVVIVDSGKDQWDAEAHGRDVDFVALAASIEAAARDLGATPDPGSARFVQLVLDAADIPAARAFWLAALGYTRDRRAHVTDIHDPHRLNPVLVLQALDATDAERRRQRNRIHIEIALPSDLAAPRITAIVAAGGRLVDESEERWRVVDPDGNELVIVAGS